MGARRRYDDLRLRALVGMHARAGRRAIDEPVRPAHALGPDLLAAARAAQRARGRRARARSLERDRRGRKRDRRALGRRAPAWREDRLSSVARHRERFPRLAGAPHARHSSVTVAAARSRRYVPFFALTARTNSSTGPESVRSAVPIA